MAVTQGGFLWGGAPIIPPWYGYWLLAIGYWLLAIGYWLLAIGYLAPVQVRPLINTLQYAY